jgi:N-acetylglucosamine malate deacetylase 2
VNGLALLERLASVEAHDLPLAVVVAHPDDETLCASTLMRRAGDLTLIHLTDGAPLGGADAARAGFTNADAYARARRAELELALDALGVRPRIRSRYALPDQATIFHLPGLIALIREDLAGCAAVITHAYEGGHPDHDTAALAVGLACEGVDMVHLEFAGYHACDGVPASGRFHSDPDAPEREVSAAAADRAARTAALACFATQARTLDHLASAQERLRLAPAYDFKFPPPPGEVLYDQWELSLTSMEWRAVAAVQAAAATDRAFV